MSKIEIATVNTPLNSHEFQDQINRNFEKISEALDNQLQRTAQEDVANYMEQELNMGGNRIVNLAKATDPSDAMRKKEFDEQISNIEQWAQEAKDSAASAAEDADDAEEARRVAVSAAQSAQEHERQTQDLFDILMADDNISVVAENIEDVKTVADDIDSVNTTADNIEDIKAVFDIAKRIAYGNIGDIRATYADVAPEGCRFTDGSMILREDYPELFELFDKGSIPYQTVSEWTRYRNEQGITASFGYDIGSNEAYLPILDEAFVEASIGASHTVRGAGLPNITGEAGNYGNGTGANYYSSGAMYVREYTGVVGESEDTQGVSSIYGIDASRSSPIYGSSHTVQPKAVVLKHYVVLTNSRPLILTMRPSVATKNALPTTGNINGDIRVVTNEGAAYVWARVSGTQWMWSSIGRVGTSGSSGFAEWGSIEGDINQQADLQIALSKKLENNATGDLSIALGAGATASGKNSVAIGFGADALGAGSIQIGTGRNNEDESLYVYLGTQRDVTGDGVAEWVGNNYKLLGSDGKIPAARLPDDIGGGYKSLDEAQKTQLLADGTYNGSEVVDGEVFTEYDGKFVEFDKTLNPGGEVDTSVTLTTDVGFCESHGYFVRAEKNTDTNYYRLVKSYDGISWTPLTGDLIRNYMPGNIFSCNNILYMGANGQKYSLDGGVTWQSTQGDYIYNASFVNIAYGNGVYVGAYQNVNPGKMAVSTDGITFEQVAFPTSRVGGGPVVFNNGVFFTVRLGEGFLSTDGRTWEKVTLPTGNFDYYRESYIAHDGYFYAVSGGSEVYRSADGRSWELFAEVPSSQNSIATDGTDLVVYNYVYDYNSAIIYENGDISTTRNYSRLGFLAYGNGKFVGAKGSFSLNPFYEYSLLPLSYNKTEVDAAIAGVDLTGYLQNTATGANSVGVFSDECPYNNCTLFGKGTDSIYENGTAIGYGAIAGARNAIQIGSGTNNEVGSFQVNTYKLMNSAGKIPEERLPSSAAKNTSANSYSIAVGSSTYPASANVGYATALGPSAIVSAQYAIQIGKGTNATANTMNVGLSNSLNVQLLNASGKIPGERMSLQGTTAPDTTTVGSIGQFYVDTATGTGYMCVGADTVTPAYTWKQITV